MQPGYYQPITTIYNLLACCRKGLGGNPDQLRRCMRERMYQAAADNQELESSPNPRLSFWLRLCRAASLLDEAVNPQPTLLVEEWLTWPFYNQMAHLLEAWLRVAKNEGQYHWRQNLLRRLVETGRLGVHQHKMLTGLRALNLVEGEGLSALGFALLNGSDPSSWPVLQPKPWVLDGRRLEVPFPPDWILLWDLELFFDPVAPGKYCLDAVAMRLAAQQEADLSSTRLLDTLAAGLSVPPPADLIAELAAQPVIRIIQGPVLEFSSSDELARLRQSSGWRQDLDRVLSPRHVALDLWQAQGVLQRLNRQGLLSGKDIPPQTAGEKLPGERLTSADRAYLLSLVLVAEVFQNVVAAPMGLLDRLSGDLAYPLRAAAARKASKVLQRLQPPADWQSDIEPPPEPDEDLLTGLQGNIDREESIEVLYQASGHHTAEYRLISPLLVEQRAGRYYLVAYCHLRRAKRTFRLDRLKLILS